MTEQLSNNKQIKSSESGKLKDGLSKSSNYEEPVRVRKMESYNKLEGAQQEKHCLSGCQHPRDAAKVLPGSTLAQHSEGTQ